LAHIQPLILAAILAAVLQAEARHAGPVAAEQVMPVRWLSENLPHGSLCTGVDLNVGCVPIEMTGQTDNDDEEVAAR
jgi:hypothetical protein